MQDEMFEDNRKVISTFREDLEIEGEMDHENKAEYMAAWANEIVYMCRRTYGTVKEDWRSNGVSC